MNPSLQEYLMQIQNEATQNEEASPPAPSNPFNSGIQRAIDAARLSLGLPSPDEQKQEALGAGIIKFGQALGQPYESNWEAVNQGLGAGINSYMQQRSQQAQMNANLYLEAIRQQEAQRQFEEQQRQHDLMNQYHVGSLEEQRRAHEAQQKHHEGSLALQKEELNLKRQALNSRNIARIEAESMPSPMGTDEVPLMAMGKKFADDWGKVAAKEISQVPINQRTIETVNNMRNIFEKYPDIGSSFLNMVENEEGKSDNTWWNLLTRQFVSDEKLTAIQQLKKLTNDLNLSTVMGLPGRSGTDIMKRAIKAAAPSGRLTYDAFNNIADSWSKRAEENINRAKTIEDSLSRGMYPKNLNEINVSNIQKPSIPQDLSQMSTDELLKLYQNE